VTSGRDTPETPAVPGPPAVPEVHFVSGFLGSGKTTAIVNACRTLLDRGIPTAIATNDQGSRQVDAAFARIARVPAVGVSNGCLCCRYDDFEERVLELAASERPKVIFAESVGSCADIVATVVKPFATFRATHRPRDLLSAFVDIRMLERRLAEQADGVRRLPFSDNVLYIFDKQLEEADIIVINKRDLLAPAGAAAVHDAAQALFPDATVILHEARDRGAAPNWLALLEEKDSADTARHPRTPRPALTLDYERYAAGEIEMAWLDEEFLLEASADSLDSPDSAGDSARVEAPTGATGTASSSKSGGAQVPLSVVCQLFGELAETLEKEGRSIAHLKIAWENGVDGGKLSLTPGDSASERDHRESDTDYTRHVDGPVTVTVNIRAVAAPDQLGDAMDHVLETLRQSESTVVITSRGRDAFRPGYPRPVHRFAGEA
jgi:G3E family GTPase